MSKIEVTVIGARPGVAEPQLRNSSRDIVVN